jgi:hypothetical protein
MRPRHRGVLRAQPYCRVTHLPRRPACRILAFHSHAPGELRPAFDIFEFSQHEAPADARTGRNGIGEAHPVQPVVDPHFHPAHVYRALQQVRQQRQREKAVRDGAAVGRFAPGPLRVDVDPLWIDDGARELVDALLADLEPGRNADLPSDLQT